MYPKSAQPQYIPGGSSNAVICLVVALFALGLRFVHVHENKKLAQAEEEVDGNQEEGRRGLGFRYVI